MSKHKIELYFSDSVEALATKLAARVHQRQSQSDPFTPQRIIVPNGNMAKYLQLHMARSNGSCCNVEFPPFERGLWDALRQIKDSSSAELLNQNSLAQLVLIALSRGVEDPELQLFNDYIADAGLAGRRKLWQLSARLAARFIEYQLHRPEMVKAWERGELIFGERGDENLTALERAQAALYRLVFASELRSEIAPTAQTLFEFARDIPRSSTLDGELHIFTPSRLAGFHRKLFCQLSTHYRIHLYHLNVCSEYWEDMSSEGEDRWLQKFNALQAAADDTNPDFFELPEDEELENDLLKAWGKPGREALKMYSELEESSSYFNIHFENSWLEGERGDERSLLATLQSDILLRRSSRDIDFSPAEMRSLQISSAPIIEREVEAVYNSILYNLETTPDLKLNEIAVLVADMGAYRTALEVAFERMDGRGKRKLNYCLVDSSCSTDSIYARGVENLFTLIEGDFIRSDFFELVRNPCFQAACGIDNETVEIWLLLCERAGIYRGYDRLYSGDDEKIFTWEEGLRRLRLGTVMVDETNPELVANANAEEVALLSLIIERLVSYRDRFRGERLPQIWATQLSLFFDDFLAVPEERRQEITVQTSLHKSLGQLALIERAALTLSLEDLRHYIGEEIQELHAGRGNYLSGGVVLASLQPMRPIPFKITYVLGLDEATFPGAVQNDSLDLRLRSRRIGDINRVESMNYLFLETLICSREKLYLSYVNEDIKKDMQRFPSTVLLQLEAYCKRLNSSFAPTQLSLYAAEEKNFRIDPELNHDIHYHFNCSEWQRLQLERGEIGELPMMTTTAAAESQVSSQPIQIHINDLAQFLSNPAAALLRCHGIAASEELDASLIEEEPFELDPLSNWALFDAALRDYLCAADGEQSFNDAVEQHYREQEARWQLPIDLFSDAAKTAAALEEPEALRSSLRAAPLPGPLVIGSAKVSRSAAIKLPALGLRLSDGRTVELIGELDLLFGDASCLRQAVVCKTSSAPFPSKHLLKPFLLWCALLALGDEGIELDPDFEIIVTGKRGAGRLRCCREHEGQLLWDRSRAERYLTELVEAFVEELPDYLPFELAQSYAAGDEDSDAKADYFSYCDAAERQLESERNRALLNLVELRYPENAAQIYRQRLGRFFATVAASDALEDSDV